MPRSPRKTICKLIAQRLETDLQSFPESRLPAIRVLCRKYDVSFVTMLKAAALVRDKGLLAYREGKPMLICGRAESKESDGRSGVAIVRRRIEEKISQGMLRAGQRLPKLQYFASECRVSRDTVRIALVELEKKKIIHRHLQMWYAGPARPQFWQYMPHAGLNSERPPTIVLIIPDAKYYPVLTNFYDARRFYHMLQLELNTFGVEIAVATIEWEDDFAAFPGGRKEISALIRKLGDRYLGCFLNAFGEESPELDDWIEWLKTFRKPVGISFMNISDEQALPPRMGHDCFRVYHSAGKAARMALDICHAAGHRHIAFLSRARFARQAWLPLRHDVLVDHARSFNDNTTITNITFSEPPGLAPKTTEWLWMHTDQCMQERIANIRASLKDPQHLTEDNRREIKRQLMQDQPELAELISRKQQTAAIAANDEIAVDFLNWMNGTGHGIPADISLISFDNNPVLSFHRFSTLDFGLADIGYLVAHRFIGDIAVQRDINGNITAMPRLFDRGTIAAPSETSKKP
jgi:DNA-binding LacI/PurR family transcriptional regulator/DNA-binding transcriptional regulator YhcF (GntR family)